MIEFCPQLQLDWTIKNISIPGLDEVKVVVTSNKQEARPAPDKRAGKDVISWPSIFTQLKHVEFYFSSCMYVNVRDDVAPGLSENDRGDGRSFQRLFDSELLKLHTDRMIENIYHYRIIGRNEIIDILCHETPNVVQIGA